MKASKLISKTLASLLLVAWIALAQSNSLAQTQLDAPPTCAADVFCLKVLPEALVPCGGEANADSIKPLAAVLQEFAQRPSSDDFSSLEKFVANHPTSPWRMAIQENLGILYYGTGFFTKCLAAHHAAWEMGKASTESSVVALADRAAGEYAKMLARVGRLAELKAFLHSVEGRTFRGMASEHITGAKEAVYLMENRPEISFRCGPLALSRILAFQNSPDWTSATIVNSASTQEGFSLGEVRLISERLGMNYQAARRSKGAPIVLPCVIHWNIGHYAAVLEKHGDLFHTEDPTFENDTWHTLNALDAESSGYFLLPPGPLPTGWTAVSEAEARTIFGKGVTDGPCKDPKPPEPPTPDDPPPPCNGKGMPTYHIRLMLASLGLRDTPVGYAPPYGDNIDFTVRYIQRDPNQPANFNFSNLGAKWNFNWMSYIVDDPANPASAAEYMADGSYITYAFLETAGGFHTFKPQFNTHRSLRRSTGVPNYEALNPDGSREIYAQPDGSSVAPRRVFLTQRIDPSGNTTSLTYDAQLRLTRITDAAGQQTVITYGHPTDPFKITRVTDPFGRFAQFAYDAAGRLQRITDVIGMASTFTYEGVSDFIDSLTTPYGTTRFSKTEAAGTRRLVATDPAGDSQVVEMALNSAVIPSSEPAAQVPTGLGITNSYNNYRNTFYWNKKQWKEYPNNYERSHIYHWNHDTNFAQMGPYLESEKAPLQSRIYYRYPGQGQSYIIGSDSLPLRIGQAIEGGSQISSASYNSFGKLSLVADPLGRSTSYDYASNGLDVIRTVQRSLERPAVGRFINAGGAAVAPFEADALFSTSNTASTGNSIDLSAAAGAAPEAVYKSVRWAQNFTCTVPSLPLRPHVVRLHFAESHVSQRVFDVLINGTLVLDDFNVLVAAGNVMNKAVVREFNAAPDAQGRIILSFVSSVENAMVCGIEIYETAASKDSVLASYSWNQQHLPLTSTDAAGQITTYAWNGNGQITSVRNAKNETTTFAYYAADAAGRQRKGRLQQIDGALAGSADAATFDYDAFGRPERVTGPDGYFVTMQYDPLDRLTRITYPDGTYDQTTWFRLDPQSRRDRLGRVTSYDYNSLRQLSSVTDPANRTIRYNWCRCGALAQLIDAMGRMTRWRHDAAGRVTHKIYPDGSTIAYAYEPLSGRLARVTDEKGQIKTRSYNLDNSLSGLSYVNAGHATPNVAFTYDRDFVRLTGMVDGIGSTAYTYHPIAPGNLGAGQIASEDGPFPNDTLTYFYDELGRNTGYAINGVGETKTFDAIGRILTAVNPLGAFGYTYVGATQRPDTVTYPNGMTCAYTWHPLNADYRLKDMIYNLPGSYLVSKFSYSYDAVGNITRWTQISPTSGLNVSWLCGYDNADQLTSVVSQNPDTLANLTTGQYAYSYDPAGNRLTSIVDGVATTGVFNALNQLVSLSKAGVAALPERTYEWDAENRLTAINYPGTNQNSRFSYDGYGRRRLVTENCGTNPPSTQSTLWRGMTLVEERAADGVTIRDRYFPRGIQRDPASLGNLRNSYLVRDHLGSMRNVVLQNNIENSFNYDPWGAPVTTSGDVCAPASAPSYSCSYGGLWKHQRSSHFSGIFRQYITDAGGWLSRDPKHEAGGDNLYRYALNSPIGQIDPLGKESWEWWAYQGLYVACELNPFCSIYSNHTDLYDERFVSPYTKTAANVAGIVNMGRNATKILNTGRNSVGRLYSKKSGRFIRNGDNAKNNFSGAGDLTGGLDDIWNPDDNGGDDPGPAPADCSPPTPPSPPQPPVPFPDFGYPFGYA